MNIIEKRPTMPPADAVDCERFRLRGFVEGLPAEELETLLKGADSKTVLLIDELPLLIGRIVLGDPAGNRAERFLLWLKRLREQYQPRWFFAGSVGLDSVARRLKLSGTIHDLQLIELGEFSPEKAREYLTGRGRFYQWQLMPDTIDAILHAVEWPRPFHLNLVVEELRAVVGEGHEAPSPALVEVALSRLMTHGRTHFDHIIGMSGWLRCWMRASRSTAR